MAERIKIGQIGVGHAHAGGKMHVYRNSPDFEVVGVVEPNERLRKNAGKSPVYRGLRWMTLQQLFDTEGLKAVAVETEVRDLLAYARKCVDRGLHIHLDKPAGTDLAAFQRVLDTAAAKHLAVQMGYMYRYNPAVLLLFEFLKNGWLGDIFELHAVMSKVVEDSERKSLAEYPGGIMFELGCHVIDLTVAILGAPERISAFGRKTLPEQDDLTDNQLAVFEYPGALASVKSAAVEVEGFSRRHLVVCGTKGTFHVQPLDSPSVRIALAEATGEHPKGVSEKRFGAYDRYVGDAADLAKIIRGEKDADFSYAHDLAVQKAVLAASGVAVD